MYNFEPARISPAIATNLEPLLRLDDVSSTVERFQQWLAPRVEDFAIELIAIGTFAVVLKLDSRENKGETTIMKAIPLRGMNAGEDDSRTSIQDAVREVELIATMSPVIGFVAFRAAKVVKGAWPVTLENLRKGYEKVQGESPLPFCGDLETTNQCWLILEMEDAGTALESIVTFTVKQIRSIFWQLATALLHAEGQLHFEHRDLHLGNVCVKPTKSWTQPLHLSRGGTNKKEMKYKLTIIDYSLSRALLEPGRIVYRDLEDDIFSGEDHPQYDVYRRMREYNTTTARRVGDQDSEVLPSQWAAYTPGTNVIWFTYIFGDLLCKLDMDAKDMKGDTKKMYEELRGFYRQLTNNGRPRGYPEYGSVTEFLSEILDGVATEDGES